MPKSFKFLKLVTLLKNNKRLYQASRHKIKISFQYLQSKNIEDVSQNSF